jgi:hypothetical protein
MKGIQEYCTNAYIVCLRGVGAVLQSATAHLRNRLPVSGKDSTPYELMTGIKPSAQHLHPFGCRAFMTVPKQHRPNKFSNTAVKGVLLGYPSNHQAYELLLSDGKTAISQHVTFVEDVLCPVSHKSSSVLSFAGG